jgi:hypothetical protein
MSDWGSSADLDFRDSNKTNRFVTAQEHPYLTGAYDERMRIIEVLEQRRARLLTAGFFDTANTYLSAINLIQGDNK